MKGATVFITFIILLILVIPVYSMFPPSQTKTKTISLTDLRTLYDCDAPSDYLAGCSYTCVVSCDEIKKNYSKEFIDFLVQRNIEVIPEQTTQKAQDSISKKIPDIPINRIMVVARHLAPDVSA